MTVGKLAADPPFFAAVPDEPARGTSIDGVTSVAGIAIDKVTPRNLVEVIGLFSSPSDSALQTSLRMWRPVCPSEKSRHLSLMRAALWKDLRAGAPPHRRWLRETIATKLPFHTALSSNGSINGRDGAAALACAFESWVDLLPGIGGMIARKKFRRTGEDVTALPAVDLP
jgi:hypothetical protein